MYFAISGQSQVICPDKLEVVYENWAIFINFVRYVYYIFKAKRPQYFQLIFLNVISKQ